MMFIYPLDVVVGDTVILETESGRKSEKVTAAPERQGDKAVIYLETMQIRHDPGLKIAIHNRPKPRLAEQSVGE